LFQRRARHSYAKYARAKFRAMGSRDRSDEPEIVSAGYAGALGRLLDRRVPVVQLFGAEDSSYEEYRAAAAGPLAGALAKAPGVVDVRTIPGKIHGFLSRPIQDGVVDAILAWGAEFTDARRVRAGTGRGAPA
jgi:hypothetical protein